MRRQLTNRVVDCGAPNQATRSVRSPGMDRSRGIDVGGRPCKSLRFMAASRRPTTHEILLIVPENGLLVEVAGLCDIFSRANLALPDSSRLPRYSWRVASTTRRKMIEGSSGLKVVADAQLAELDPTQPWGTVIVTGRGPQGAASEAVSDWLRLAARRAGRVVSVCAGAFLLAEAGLLDGKRATTHWQRSDELARRHPRVLVDPTPIYTQDGRIFTSGGATAGFDLALWLVERDLGFTIAQEVAKTMVLYLRRPGGQSQFSKLPAPEASSESPIRAVQVWILEHLKEDLRVERLARRSAMSPRNFARVFTDEVGTTPARYVEELRLEAAKRRLENSNGSIERIAADCGFGSAVNLRRVFQRQLGIAPREYAERFGRI
jgi:transcriptional regulator GlxA family with amidase domain